MALARTDPEEYDRQMAHLKSEKPKLEVPTGWTPRGISPHESKLYVVRIATPPLPDHKDKSEFIEYDITMYDAGNKSFTIEDIWEEGEEAIPHITHWCELPPLF